MRGGSNPRWQPHEDATLRRWWGRIPPAKVAAKLPGRSAIGCQVRASKLKIKSARWEAATRGDAGYKGDDFYLGILADFAKMSAGRIAIRRRQPLNRVRCWIARAKRYRDAGKFGNPTGGNSVAVRH